MEKMKNGELRQFFLSAKSWSGPEVAGKVFLVVSARQTSADVLMDGILYKGWSIDYLNSNSKVIDETG